ncbi:MAG TPA: hypothetical protein VMW81_06830 [Nitrospinota bacterium]|nr:hypothetical protein [Nitrospinota bacterium]
MREAKFKLSYIAVFIVVVTFTIFCMPQLVFAVARDAIITNNGQSVPNATVVIETAEGKPIAKSTTDENGRAEFDLPEESYGKSLKVTLEPAPLKIDTAAPMGLNLKHEIPATTGGEPWSRFSMDLGGGFSTFSKDVVSVIEKAAEPINVGSNSAVGTGAQTKQKVVETVGGALGGMLGGLGPMSFGGRGDDVGDSEPELAEDPVPETVKRVFTDPATGTKIKVGGKMTPDGLRISTTILDSPDKGTFQAVYLMDDKGNKAGPVLYDIYELYQEWTLTVSWTYTRWSGGEQIEHKEGGWSESGSNILGTFAVPKENDGIWKQMGFSNAVAGVRGLGTLFPVNPEMLQNQPMHLVVHVTKPSQQAVNTTGYVMSMPPNAMSGNNVGFIRSF